MATGGIFTIITNDGKQDRMLMATALLHERLRAINEFKQKRNGRAADDLVNLPTLLDIEKTHFLFTNAHFKPFAAIGFEYNKVRATSGNPSLGSSIQFSIPQFGDFFHDICCHAVLLQPTLNSTASINSNAPLMRWAAFPGEALLQQRTDDAPTYPSYYSMFGGKIDEGESPETCAVRECKEELEYEMTQPVLVVHDVHNSEYGGKEKYIYVEKYDGTQALVLHEGQGMKWVSENALADIEMIPQDKHYLKEIFKHNFKPIENPQKYQHE